MSSRRLRMTKQRRIILDELAKASEHPCASDVYKRVKRRLPQISLGTVYRNLDILSSQGIIKRLEIGSGQMRFDAVTDEHHHVRCVVCGRIDDISLGNRAVLQSLLKEAGRTSGYAMTGLSVDLAGICPECRSRGAKVHSDKNMLQNTYTRKGEEIVWEK